jgi:hypothetical protein
MGEAEIVNSEVCKVRHQLVDSKFDGIEKEIETTKSDIKDIQKAQLEYNATINKIYVTLLIIAFSTILTLGGVILGRAIDFHIPF